jgi:hypothetical protein
MKAISEQEWYRFHTAIARRFEKYEGKLLLPDKTRDVPLFAGNEARKHGKTGDIASKQGYVPGFALRQVIAVSRPSHARRTRR